MARIVTARPLLPVLVLLLVSGLAVGAFVALRGVVGSQEQRLLDERATEVAAYLRATTTQTASSLLAAGEAAALDGRNRQLFATLATPLAANGATVAVLQQDGDRFVTRAVLGGAAAVGRPATPRQARLIAQATAAGGTTGSGGLVYDFLPGGRRNLVIEGIAVPGATSPTVALLQTDLPHAVPITPASTSPYRELNAVLYAGTTPDPRYIVLISNALPGRRERTAQALVQIGAESALVVVSPHGPLVGSFAESVPWIVLGAGCLLALLLALLVEVLTRRRAYALNLVEERTRDMYRAQLAAETANRSKSEFLSRMSHELRTPLNAVLGFSQLLELDELTPDQEQAVAQITKGGRHLLDLINEILDISQIETGRLALSPEPVDVREVVGESVDLIGPLATERGIHLIKSDTGACAEHVFADRQRLKQILLNLLGNGIKYNREGGTVSISCAQRVPGTLSIRVTDTGTGIPEEQLDRLFTPFERLGAERTTVEGTGIGLALSRRLAEVMGGTLTVESTVGRGSTFSVELPVVETPVARAERLAELDGAEVLGRDAGDAPAVLHVEDNLANIHLIERVLAQRPGVRLIPAMQGRLGLELARQHQPILILLDLNLADVAGEEVLHALRGDDATAHIPVAIISADAMPRQVQRLLCGGATAYLTKPIDVRQLLDLVDRAIEAHDRRDSRVSTGAAASGGDPP